MWPFCTSCKKIYTFQYEWSAFSMLYEQDVMARTKLNHVTCVLTMLCTWSTNKEIRLNGFGPDKCNVSTNKVSCQILWKRFQYEWRTWSAYCTSRKSTPAHTTHAPAIEISVYSHLYKTFFFQEYYPTYATILSVHWYHFKHLTSFSMLHKFSLFICF